MLKGQLKHHSLLESIINVIIGYSIAIGAQLVIFPLYGINIPLSSNLQIGGWMTIVSIIRSYGIRRWFNNITIKHIYKI